MPVGTSVPAYDVIVAGAGPVGLTLTIDLGRRGVRCLLIERSPTTLPYPKTVSYTHLTLPTNREV